LLADLCRRIDHVGALGDGARMKLAANLLLVVFWQALGESLSLAGPRASMPRAPFDLLADSNIAAGILRARGSQIVAAMNGERREAGAFGRRHDVRTCATWPRRPPSMAGRCRWRAARSNASIARRAMAAGASTAPRIPRTGSRTQAAPSFPREP